MEKIIIQIRRLWLYAIYFLRTQKSWSWPRESKVLIYDACNHEIFMEYLLPWKPEVLHVRGEQINMRVFFASLFRRGRKSDAYVDCFIEKVRPRLIITIIDNSLSFQSIGLRHPGVKTLFIQNGHRSYFADLFESLDKMDAPGLGKLKVDYMLCFGAIVGAEYGRYIQGTAIPIGSIKNNQKAIERPIQRDMIAFISQWHPNGFAMDGIFYSQEKFFGETDRLILRYLVDFAREKKKKLVIVPRNPRGGQARGQEEAYFRALVGENCEFSDPEGTYPSYEAVDAAEVVVAVDTTLGYESIARGKKTAIFSIRSSLLGIRGLTYGWPGTFPDIGPFWSNCPVPESFGRILDHLFEADDSQWQRDLQATDFPAVMIRDPGNSILQSILTTELGQPHPQQGETMRRYVSDKFQGSSA
jgi:surface carbohydrate biosynthesis protein